MVEAGWLPGFCFSGSSGRNKCCNAMQEGGTESLSADFLNMH
jgi:hypothetical protein